MGSQESMNAPRWIIIGFQQKDKQDSQSLKIDTFYRLHIVSAQCIIGTENCPDAGIFLNYDDDDYSQGFSQIKEAFRTLTKEPILQPYIFDDDFRSSKARVNNIRYNLFVFDVSYQQNFTTSQPIKVEFKFDGVVLNAMNCYALALTNKLVSLSSDGQRNFDLNQV